MKAESGGVGFFFAREQEARKFLDFVQEVVPCRYVASKKLKTHNTHDNYYNDKHNYSIEIVPVCRENIVALPKKLSQSLGNLSQICICIHVTNLISLIDPFFLNLGELPAEIYFENRSLQFAPKQLTEFVVMEMEFADSADVCTTGEVQSTKHISSDVYVSRPNEIVMCQTHTRTHLGCLLRPGDTVLCFYFRYSNMNHPVLETMKGDKKFQTSKSAVRLDLPRRTAATVLWNSTAETKPIGASFVDIFIWHAPV